MGENPSRRSRVTLILGAGASRGVSYASEMRTQSPLDNDFFELLQRLDVNMQPNGIRVKAERAIQSIVGAATQRRGESLWQSMERMFYTLHLSAVLQHKLFPGQVKNDPAKELLANFARATQALLRAAHGTNACEYHTRLFQALRGTDAVLTFNYDLVPERALKRIHRARPFGRWLYGLDPRPAPAAGVPMLYKLHGSVNWTLKSDPSGQVGDINVWPGKWSGFDKQPGYLARGPAFPILLPYWDKRIEQEPWLGIWRHAAAQLRSTETLVVWGYSLPLTDLKARELLRLSLQTRHATLKKVCVIDPSRRTRDRWRSMFVSQRFWQFREVGEFIDFLEREGGGATDLGPLSRN